MASPETFAPNPAAARRTRLAAAGILFAGALWGLYWIPIRRLEALALGGVWGSLIVALVTCCLLAPWALAGRARLRRCHPLGILAVLLGGAAFMCYSVGLVQGQVAVVILLFYLTPVWSSLIERLWWRWPLTGRRLAVIALGLGGLTLVLGAAGSPLPRTLGDWLGLVSGVLWAVASSGMRARSTLGPGEGSFVFALGAVLGALALTPLLGPWPGLPPMPALGQAVAWIAVSATLWWAISLAIVVWAASVLAPARLGILMMSEVLVGVLSAALFAGEPLSALQLGGALLVIAAAVLEVAPLPGHRLSGTAR
ncbi:DMT family transporter [Salinicola sp. DM10]|uniref:DMT family transporter n=1 Tax=Salinicola sp. DM10 TaxID=2815721 RepID=UPI001E57D207|nr:DMT family transporter [Salinicola sp. DM10]MCE3028449.1 DMT family transporter [Salinicola sp. DM10]